LKSAAYKALEIGDDEKKSPVQEKMVWLFHEIDRFLTDIPHSCIGFVGPRGGGKTTLVNSILEADLLPEGDFGCTTAAITEIRPWDKNTYFFTVYFIEQADWETDLLEVQSVEEDDTELRNAFKDKLKALWERDMDIVNTLIKKIQTVNPIDLLPKSILTCIHNEYLSKECSTILDLQKELRKFTHKNEKYWPIVKQIFVWGTFTTLQKAGVSIMDIPGKEEHNIYMTQLHDRGVSQCSQIFYFPKRDKIADLDTKNDCEDPNFFLRGESFNIIIPRYEALLDSGEFGKTYEEIEKEIRSRIELCDQHKIFLVESKAKEKFYDLLENFKTFAFKKNLDFAEERLDKALQHIKNLSLILSDTLHQAKYGDLELPNFESILPTPGEITSFVEKLQKKTIINKTTSSFKV